MEQPKRAGFSVPLLLLAAFARNPSAFSKFVGLCLFFAIFPARAQTWQTAQPGLAYAFPRDHGPHPAFKTEWWYFTGGLHEKAPAAREFGFELTFFRQGLRPPGSLPATTSRFVVPAFAFAHFALSDPAANQFRCDQKISRGAYGEAGWNSGPGKLAWIEDWNVDLLPDGAFLLSATSADFAVALRLTPAKQPTIHGERGISQKADGEGRASHYYSLTRMRTEGEIVTHGKRTAVEGETWFDHEWATNQLGAHQVGWNWLSLQMADGSDLMLYQMRTNEGGREGVDPNSSGTFIRADGSALALRAGDFKLTRLAAIWKSAATGATYPIEWRVEIPKAGLDLNVATPLQNQELALPPIAYWEGLVHANGSRDGHPANGHGYLEMTGYAGPLIGISDGK